VLSLPESGAKTLHVFDHPSVRWLSTPPKKANAIRKVEFAKYVATAAWISADFRPDLIYASDALSALPALIASAICGAKIVYHEHDAPPAEFSRKQAGRWRASVVRQAMLVITPNAARGKLLHEEVGGRADRFRTVWNTPRLQEVPEHVTRKDSGELALYYHGSLSPDRLPVQLAAALAGMNGRVHFEFVGYETPGAPGLIDTFMRAANGHATYGGVLDREAALSRASHSAVGVSLVAMRPPNINMRHMVGASNKAFDYMCAGLPLLVSDVPDWHQAFVATGFAKACCPDNVESIASALQWYLENPVERHCMGARARDKIRLDWNYEGQFAPILADLASMVR